MSGMASMFEVVGGIKRSIVFTSQTVAAWQVRMRGRVPHSDSACLPPQHPDKNSTHFDALNQILFGPAENISSNDLDLALGWLAIFLGPPLSFAPPGGHSLFALFCTLRTPVDFRGLKIIPERSLMFVTRTFLDARASFTASEFGLNRVQELESGGKNVRGAITNAWRACIPLGPASVNFPRKGARLAITPIGRRTHAYKTLPENPGHCFYCMEINVLIFLARNASSQISKYDILARPPPPLQGSQGRPYRHAKLDRRLRWRALHRPFAAAPMSSLLSPGRSQPCTSLQQRSSKLLPISGPSSTGAEEEKRVARFAAEWKTRRHTEEQTRALRAKKLQQVPQRQYFSAGTCSQLSQKAEEADADILATFKRAGRKNGRAWKTLPQPTHRRRPRCFSACW
ncbi:hypothetical protein B0H14DRAFT_2564087 [Mycena olivaceomarginata]|nr:hypothetical protein B0H14DRAFT_2564087 [Mycena olivaceomarginata]